MGSVGDSAAVVRDVAEVTPAWLSAVLGRAVRGVEVARVHDEQVKTLSYFLSAQLVDGEVARLVLKVPRGPSTGAVGFSSGEREVRMYRAFMRERDALPVVRCFSAEHEPERGLYHLLLEDLSETHGQPAWHLDVDALYVARTVDCLARLHARWWGRPPDAETAPPGYPSLGAPGIHDLLVAALPGFFDALGDALASEERRLVERAVAALPALVAPRGELAEQTLVHGDAHFWNFLYPRDPARADTRALDWQTGHVGPAAEDLAYLLALRDPHRTAERERAFLRRYHEALAAAGVDLGWEELRRQYRLLAAEQLLTPLYWHARGAPADFWPIFVPRALAAFRELGCQELL